MQSKFTARASSTTFGLGSQDRRQLVRICLKSRKVVKDLESAQRYADSQSWGHLCCEIFMGPRFVVFFRKAGAP